MMWLSMSVSVWENPLQISSFFVKSTLQIFLCKNSKIIKKLTFSVLLPICLTFPFFYGKFYIIIPL